MKGWFKERATSVCCSSVFAAYPNCCLGCRETSCTCMVLAVPTFQFSCKRIWMRRFDHLRRCGTRSRLKRNGAPNHLRSIKTFAINWNQKFNRLCDICASHWATSPVCPLRLRTRANKQLSIIAEVAVRVRLGTWRFEGCSWTTLAIHQTGFLGFAPQRFRVSLALCARKLNTST